MRPWATWDREAMLRSLAPLTVTAALVLGGCTATDRAPEADRSTPEPTPSQAGTPAQPTYSYVALGDSFTAAPGIPETDTSDGCLRSSQNYPAQVAERLEADYDVELADRSCSGADTTGLTAEQAIGRDPVPPQLDALSRGTNLVTLSMGGNDYGIFLQLVGGCVGLAQQDPQGSPCTDAAEAQSSSLAETQQRIQQRLVDAVAEIRQRAPRAQVLLVGYPQLVPRAGECRDLLPLATGDLPLAREINKTLTDNLAVAARRSDTTYVDVWSASAGHDICSDDPWVNGQQGQQGGAIPFHPLLAGQRGVAEAVLDAIG